MRLLNLESESSMRQVVCDNSSCELEPSSQVGEGNIQTDTKMTGGNVGIAPEESSYYIPLKSKLSTTKRVRRTQIGGGRKRKRTNPLRTVKKTTKRTRKVHSSKRRCQNKTVKPICRRKAPKRKCVRRKK